MQMQSGQTAQALQTHANHAKLRTADVQVTSVDPAVQMEGLFGVLHMSRKLLWTSPCGWEAFLSRVSFSTVFISCRVQPWCVFEVRVFVRTFGVPHPTFVQTKKYNRHTKTDDMHIQSYIVTCHSNVCYTCLDFVWSLSLSAPRNLD